MYSVLLDYAEPILRLLEEIGNDEMWLDLILCMVSVRGKDCNDRRFKLNIHIILQYTIRNIGCLETLSMIENSMMQDSIETQIQTENKDEKKDEKKNKNQNKNKNNKYNREKYRAISTALKYVDASLYKELIECKKSEEKRFHYASMLTDHLLQYVSQYTLARYRIGSLASMPGIFGFFFCFLQL